MMLHRYAVCCGHHIKACRGQPKCNGEGTVDVTRGWSSNTVQAQAKQADKNLRSAAGLAHWFLLG